MNGVYFPPPLVLPRWCVLKTEADRLRYRSTLPDHLASLNGDAKEFVTLFSLHGATHMFGDSAASEDDPSQWVDLRQARAEAFYWICNTETFGGDAIIVHGPTKRDIGAWYNWWNACGT